MDVMAAPPIDGGEAMDIDLHRSPVVDEGIVEGGGAVAAALVVNDRNDDDAHVAAGGVAPIPAPVGAVGAVRLKKADDTVAARSLDAGSRWDFVANESHDTIKDTFTGAVAAGEHQQAPDFNMPAHITARNDAAKMLPPKKGAVAKAAEKGKEAPHTWQSGRISFECTTTASKTTSTVLADKAHEWRGKNVGKMCTFTVVFEAKDKAYPSNWFVSSANLAHSCGHAIPCSKFKPTRAAAAGGGLGQLLDSYATSSKYAGQRTSDASNLAKQASTQGYQFSSSMARRVLTTKMRADRDTYVDEVQILMPYLLELKRTDPNSIVRAEFRRLGYEIDGAPEGSVQLQRFVIIPGWVVNYMKFAAKVESADMAHTTSRFGGVMSLHTRKSAIDDMIIPVSYGFHMRENKEAWNATFTAMLAASNNKQIDLLVTDRHKGLEHVGVEYSKLHFYDVIHVAKNSGGGKGVVGNAAQYRSGVVAWMKTTTPAASSYLEGKMRADFGDAPVDYVKALAPQMSTLASLQKGVCNLSTVTSQSVEAENSAFTRIRDLPPVSAINEYLKHGARLHGKLKASVSEMNAQGFEVVTSLITHMEHGYCTHVPGQSPSWGDMSMSLSNFGEDFVSAQVKYHATSSHANEAIRNVLIRKGVRFESGPGKVRPHHTEYASCDCGKSRSTGYPCKCIMYVFMHYREGIRVSNIHVKVNERRATPELNFRRAWYYDPHYTVEANMLAFCVDPILPAADFKELERYSVWPFDVSSDRTSDRRKLRLKSDPKQTAKKKTRQHVFGQGLVGGEERVGLGVAEPDAPSTGASQHVTIPAISATVVKKVTDTEARELIAGIVQEHLRKNTGLTRVVVRRQNPASCLYHYEVGTFEHPLGTQASDHELRSQASKLVRMEGPFGPTDARTAIIPLRDMAFPTVTTDTLTLPPLARVMAIPSNFSVKSQKYYPGTVISTNEDSTCVILFDDDELHGSISRSRITCVDVDAEAVSYKKLMLTMNLRDLEETLQARRLSVLAGGAAGGASAGAPAGVSAGASAGAAAGGASAGAFAGASAGAAAGGASAGASAGAAAGGVQDGVGGVSEYALKQAKRRRFPRKCSRCQATDHVITQCWDKSTETLIKELHLEKTDVTSLRVPTLDELLFLDPSCKPLDWALCSNDTCRVWRAGVTGKQMNNVSFTCATMCLGLTCGVARLGEECATMEDWTTFMCRRPYSPGDLSDDSETPDRKKDRARAHEDALDAMDTRDADSESDNDDDDGM